MNDVLYGDIVQPNFPCLLLKVFQTDELFNLCYAAGVFKKISIVYDFEIDAPILVGYVAKQELKKYNGGNQ